jgi:hypothetical protein
VTVLTARWRQSSRSPPPKWAAALSPCVGVARGDPPPFPFLHQHCSALFRSQLPVCSPLPATVVTFHCRSSGSKAAPQCPLRLPSTSSPSHRPMAPGEAIIRAAVFLPLLHHQPPFSVLLRPSYDFQRVHLSSTFLYDYFTVGDRWSAPPSSSSPQSSFLSSPLHYSERRTVQPPPIGSPWTQRHPRQNLVRPLTVGGPDLAGEATGGKGERLSHVSGSGPKGSSGSSPAAQYLFLFSF